MGTHIAGVFPKYFAGWQWGCFGIGNVEHVLFHVWTLWWERSFMVHKSSCFRAGVAMALEIHLNICTANSWLPFGGLVACWESTYSQVTWSEYSLLEFWGPLFISLGFVYQNYILSSVCNVTYKCKFSLMAFFLIWKGMNSNITCLVKHYGIAFRHISLYGQTVFPGICTPLVHCFWVRFWVFPSFPLSNVGLFCVFLIWDFCLFFLIV